MVNDVNFHAPNLPPGNPGTSLTVQLDMTLDFDPDHTLALAADVRDAADRCQPAHLPEQDPAPSTAEFLRALADATARLNDNTGILHRRLATIAADADTTVASARTSDGVLSRALEESL